MGERKGIKRKQENQGKTKKVSVGQMEKSWEKNESGKKKKLITRRANLTLPDERAAGKGEGVLPVQNKNIKVQLGFSKRGNCVKNILVGFPLEVQKQK